MWLDLPFAQVSRSVEQTVHTTFSFPRSSFRIRRTTVLGMFKDSNSLRDAIRRSFLTISATAAMFTLVRVDFGRPPLSSSSTSSHPYRNREKSPKNLIGSELHSRKSFTPVLVFLLQTDQLWIKILWQLRSFPPSMTYKENWLCKTIYSSYTVEDKQTKLGVFTDVGW
jgi:hypothetical protein